MGLFIEIRHLPSIFLAIVRSRAILTTISLLFSSKSRTLRSHTSVVAVCLPSLGGREDENVGGILCDPALHPQQLRGAHCQVLKYASSITNYLHRESH